MPRPFEEDLPILGDENPHLGRDLQLVTSPKLFTDGKPAEADTKTFSIFAEGEFARMPKERREQFARVLANPALATPELRAAIVRGQIESSETPSE